MLLEFMSEYDVSDFRVLSDRYNSQPDRLKSMFKIKDQNLAIKCYQDFCFQQKTLFNDTVRIQLYLQKPEAIFVKYADEEGQGKTE